MHDIINVFWFRRDLRLHDNHGLFEALRAGRPVLPIFIFDTTILDHLEDKKDARVSFIYENLQIINKVLSATGRSLLVLVGKPTDVIGKLISSYKIEAIYANRDYEPYALKRDLEIYKLLLKKNIEFKTFKDQVIFESEEILKPDGKPYTVFTPYSRKWKEAFHLKSPDHFPSENHMFSFLSGIAEIPDLNTIGFSPSEIVVPEARINHDILKHYQERRNQPFPGQTSLTGTHLRFGTISIRQLAMTAGTISETYLNELIWREFFMQILVHFPYVTDNNFNRKYDRLIWRNNEAEFDRWCNGTTGYPLVDAGMRQLNQTGLMHNRVRMVTAGFLTKHLLIDWRWGEAYFAKKLLDFELSSNNGNWQWAAGTGCDAAPYFRIFNPTEQARKFDPQADYVRFWIQEYEKPGYPDPVVDHAMARERAIAAFREALKS